MNSVENPPQGGYTVHQLHITASGSTQVTHSVESSPLYSADTTDGSFIDNESLLNILGNSSELGHPQSNQTDNGTTHLQHNQSSAPEQCQATDANAANVPVDPYGSYRDSVTFSHPNDEGIFEVVRFETVQENFDDPNYDSVQISDSNFDDPDYEDVDN